MTVNRLGSLHFKLKLTVDFRVSCLFKYVFMKIILYLALLVFFNSSCSLFYPLLGFRNPKPLSDEKIVKYARKAGIENEHLYKIDPRLFEAFDTLANTTLRNDLMQPLQLLYFDSSDSAKLHLPNCYIGGYPLLLWNNEGSFDHYPPEQKLFREIDTTIYKPHLLYYIQPLSGSIFYPEDFNGEVLVILYSRLLHKNVKHLVGLMNTYQDKFPQAKVVYVNIDNGYFYDEVDN